MNVVPGYSNGGLVGSPSIKYASEVLEDTSLTSKSLLETLRNVHDQAELRDILREIREQDRSSHNYSASHDVLRDIRVTDRQTTDRNSVSRFTDTLRSVREHSSVRSALREVLESSARRESDRLTARLSSDFVSSRVLADHTETFREQAHDRSAHKSVSDESARDSTLSIRNVSSRLAETLRQVRDQSLLRDALTLIREGSERDVYEVYNSVRRVHEISESVNGTDLYEKSASDRVTADRALRESIADRLRESAYESWADHTEALRGWSRDVRETFSALIGGSSRDRSSTTRTDRERSTEAVSRFDGLRDVFRSVAHELQSNGRTDSTSQASLFDRATDNLRESVSQ